MLLSLILFGSKARGDARLTSDTDLLGITDGGAIRMENNVRGVSHYRYPFSYLKKKSSEGDLFLAHLVFEGKTLHDTANAVEQINSSFKFKISYETEVEQAHAIIDFMVGKRRLLRTKKQRSRLIWAMRTVLIARQAEREKVSFASGDLEDFSGYRELKAIIDKRYTIDVDKLANAAEFIADSFGSEFVHRNFPYEDSKQKEFLAELGGVAADTASVFLPPMRRRKVLAQSRETLGYAIFEPE